MRVKKILGLGFLSLALVGCGTTANTTVSKIDSTLNEGVKADEYKGLKRTVAIARFSNETEYAKGAFYDKESDPIGKQALDILSAKLAATGKFILLERADSDKIQAELEKSGSSAKGTAADYLILGSVTEFGRKTTGEVGFVSRSKTQTVEAGVNLRLVDVASGQVIYAEEGKGQAETSSSTTFGMGGVQGFDATLSDKAISAAIEKLVENIEKTCMDRPWKSYFLSYDKDAVIIAGGAKQNINAGKVLSVYQRGKQVKNPQTGMMIELPGTKVGEVTVLSVGGTTVLDEYAIVNVTSGTVDGSKISDYVIQEN
ncbi:MAG: hypothetical protein KBT11_06180, partial [Treponema sp.]|nr:hypothetical protein [Candidatus Treponema equifaecale]